MLFTKVVAHALARHGLDVRGDAPFPRQLAPMLMYSADALIASPDFTYEPKWDGFRVIVTIREGSVRLLSRNGHSFTRLFGPVTDALREFPTSLVLDGEVIAINDRGQPDFEALQARLRPRNGKLPGYLCYMVFDALYINGHSLLSRPLEERQAILWDLQPALQTDAVKLAEGFPAEKSQRLMKACAAMGLEGVIMKRKTSLYRLGFRTRDWIKVPLRQREEFVVAGYVPGARGFSTLILGQNDSKGNFVYVGSAGRGYPITRARSSSKNSKPRKERRAPFARYLNCGMTFANYLRRRRSGCGPASWSRLNIVRGYETGSGMRRSKLSDPIRNPA